MRNAGRAFDPGEHILLRQVWLGKVWFVRPVTVVRNTPELIALYLAPGSICKWPRTKEGQKLRIPQDDWVLQDVPWVGCMLRLTVPGEAHSVLLFWDESGQFVSWYIDLETQMSRTPLGFDYMDQMLDIVVAPDLSWWRWKDEDELEECVRLGLWNAAQAAAVRAEGERALARLLAREPPFDERWEDWRPDPTWDPPQIRSGWQTVSERRDAPRAAS